MQIISNVVSGAALSLRVYALHGHDRVCLCYRFLQNGSYADSDQWVIAVLLPVFVAEIAIESVSEEGLIFPLSQEVHKDTDP